MKEENTLTAKEWLVSKLGNPGGKYTEEQEINICMMEQYANYKNRILEGKILQFRQTVKNTIQPIQVEEYDEYFGIQTTREGRIQ
jgi:hypothetical protein